jgi:transposase Tn5 family protein
VQTDQRWLNALALSRIVAWRRHHITMTGRAYPDAPCDVVCEPREWHALSTMQQHRPPPQAPPSLRAMVRGLAQLGAFLARTGDGEPGITAIWQGHQRLHAFISAVETHRPLNALEKCIMVSGQA